MQSLKELFQVILEERKKRESEERAAAERTASEQKQISALLDVLFSFALIFL